MLGKIGLILVLLLWWGCTEAFSSGDNASEAERYIRAYPDFFTAYEDGCLLAKTGEKFLLDDLRQKNFDRLIVDGSIGDETFDPEDVFYWDYGAGEPIPTEERPPAGDPGRIRPAVIFNYMYGPPGTHRSKNMRSVQWVGSANGKPKTIRVTAVNGVDKALERVACEIMNLPDEMKKSLEDVVFDVEGPYGYFERPVRDYPNRTSGHAYGIAVDINGDLFYFAGSHRDEPYCYRNNVPQFLVDIFERNGFIWGGRWHSYDAMHFEYRPELLQK